MKIVQMHYYPIHVIHVMAKSKLSNHEIYALYVPIVQIYVCSEYNSKQWDCSLYI